MIVHHDMTMVYDNLYKENFFSFDVILEIVTYQIDLWH